MDTRTVVARFEAERQALALMDHPNIAKVLDAGTTETGRPYFVMELIRGIPITEYCDDNKLTVRERLGLFTHLPGGAACTSEGYHSSRYQALATFWSPNKMANRWSKVIDFGVAKALSQSRTETHCLYERFRHDRYSGLHEPGTGSVERRWMLTRAATCTLSEFCCMNSSPAPHLSIRKS